MSFIEPVRRSEINFQNTSDASSSQRSESAPITADVAAGRARLLHEIGSALAEFDNEAEVQAEAQENAEPAKIAGVIDPTIALLMRNASVLIRAREHRLATNLLRNVLIRAPQYPEALAKMGLCSRELGRFEEALKCFRALVKLTKSVDAQVGVAESLYLSERDDMALAAYREVLKRVVSDPSTLFDIYKNVGNIHVRAGDFDAAEEFYNKAYNLNPLSDVLMVNYGTLEIQRGHFGEAVERFRSAVAINLNNDRGWVGLAMVHRQMGDHELAKANLQRALDINPNNRTAIRLVVEWGVQDKDFGSALQRLQDYISSDGGEDAEMCFSLAKIFIQMGRLSDARIEMERVLALDPMIENGDKIAQALDSAIEAARLQSQDKTQGPLGAQVKTKMA